MTISLGLLFVAKNVGLTITKKESSQFINQFQLDFSTNSLCKLALENFKLAYYSSNRNVRFILLMTALESLFNQGADQIAHTIARHLSLIKSKNSDEFRTNYSRIKKLYGFRSKLVHGDKIDEDMKDLILELEQDVRLALNYCLSVNLTKQQLFEHLNCRGYGSF